MSNFCLNPGDILVNINHRKDPFSKVKRWAAGPYEHIFLYMGKVGLFINQRQRRLLRVPLLFESDGDGVIVESLSSRYGQEVVVLRLKSEFDRRRIPRVLEEAVKLADDPQSHYDYMCIVKYVLPRLILEKLGLPTWVLHHLPLAWQRDARQICSEAVNEIFIRAGLLLLYLEDVPLPGDFVTGSVMLETVWAGRLSEELV